MSQKPEPDDGFEKRTKERRRKAREWAKKTREDANRVIEKMMDEGFGG